MNRKRMVIALSSVFSLLLFTYILYRVWPGRPCDLGFYPNFLSLFWVAISLVFLSYSARALRIFHRARWTARHGDLVGKRRRIAIDLANDYLTGERARAGQHLLSAIAGIESLLIRPVPRDSPLDTLHAAYSLQVVVIFIVINVLSGTNSMRAVYSWSHREEVIRGLRKRGV